ncbi:1137_t:CDS:2 [Diversispora eburnea]|uniref:1137_t:CDS:1 n=1 Tax=Diversispora eburnea TaxID=1213867 RepID=A0A9N9CJX1_9GLOM|nr:1137_t:CDS:2 [Diversispora eburnea]
MIKYSVILVDVGTIVEDYIMFNILDIVQINKENSLISQYYCEYNNGTSVSSSSRWDNEEMVQKLYENIRWIPFSIYIGTFEIFVYPIGLLTGSLVLNAGNGYKSSLIHILE